MTNRPSQTHHGILVAHRGYPAAYPENTYLSIEQAIIHGAHAVEFDVQCSADGTPYVFHDATLERMTGKKGIIHETTDAELNSLSAYFPKRFGTRFLGEPISTLARMTELLQQHPHVHAFIEPKSDSLDTLGTQRLMDAIFEVTQPIKAQRSLISFHYKAMEYAKSKGEHVVWVIDHFDDTTEQRAQTLAPDVLCIDVAELSTQASGTPPNWALSQQTFQWMIYPVDCAEHIEQLFEAGVSYVETDAVGEVVPQKKGE